MNTPFLACRIFVVAVLYLLPTNLLAGSVFVFPPGSFSLETAWRVTIDGEIFEFVEDGFAGFQTAGRSRIPKLVDVSVLNSVIAGDPFEIDFFAEFRSPTLRDDFPWDDLFITFVGNRHRSIRATTFETTLRILEFDPFQAIRYDIVESGLFDFTFERAGDFSPETAFLLGTLPVIATSTTRDYKTLLETDQDGHDVKIEFALTPLDPGAGVISFRVPEPTTMRIAGFALVGLVGVRRRR